MVLDASVINVFDRDCEQGKTIRGRRTKNVIRAETRCDLGVTRVTRRRNAAQRFKSNGRRNNECVLFRCDSVESIDVGLNLSK